METDALSSCRVPSPTFLPSLDAIGSQTAEKMWNRRTDGRTNPNYSMITHNQPKTGHFLIFSTRPIDRYTIVQSTRPSVAYLEQIEREMDPVQFFAQLYAEYHTKSLVCSVGWNHVKFQPSGDTKLFICCLGD